MIDFRKLGYAVPSQIRLAMHEHMLDQGVEPASFDELLNWMARSGAEPSAIAYVTAFARRHGRRLERGE